MARKGRKKHRSGKARVSIISLAPVAYVGATAFTGYKNDGAKGAMNATVAATTGFDMQDGKWHAEYLIPMVGVVGGAYVAKKLVSMAGVNRSLRGLPFRL